MIENYMVYKMRRIRRLKIQMINVAMNRRWKQMLKYYGGINRIMQNKVRNAFYLMSLI